MSIKGLLNNSRQGLNLHTLNLKYGIFCVIIPLEAKEREVFQMMTKVWYIEAVSAVGGLLDMLSDFGSEVEFTLKSTDIPMYWEITVKMAPRLVSTVENIIALYV